MFNQILAYARLFPPAGEAPPDSPLCYGGDLKPARLLAAYYLGLFPWFNAGDPVFWWSPDPRCVLFPGEFHLSERARRKFKSSPFRVTMNAAFSQVIEACSLPRKGHAGTWLVPEMITAYNELHALGYAVSFEAWRGSELAGGLYGIWLGKIFFGESMFYFLPDASKAAFAALAAHLSREGCRLIDCQQDTVHLRSLGARCISRAKFLKLLRVFLPDFRSAFIPHHEKKSWDDERLRS